MNLIEKTKQKREFSGLPDTLIEKVLEQKQIKNKSDEEKVKLTRAFLRKYFGVFLTNKVLKGKDEMVLKSHISSKKRDYTLFYKHIVSVTGSKFKTIIDFGCGMNGFSYPFILGAFGEITYLGVESTRQLCDLQNSFFEKNNFSKAKVIWGDLFNSLEIKEIVCKSDCPRLIFLLQVVDALENIEPNFSKEFLISLKSQLNKEDVLVISNPLKSISGRNRFDIKRRWLEEFIKENFVLIDKFDLFEEEFLIAKGI
ncbi:MAG: hypothetical protein WCI72_03680 [archaeon]